MARRSIQLRWHGRCSVCRCELGAGELTLFDEVTREVICLSCTTGRPATPRVAAMRTQPPRTTRRHETVAERERIRALIADARAALEAVHQAG